MLVVTFDIFRFVFGCWCTFSMDQSCDRSSDNPPLTICLRVLACVPHPLIPGLCASKETWTRPTQWDRRHVFERTGPTHPLKVTIWLRQLHRQRMQSCRIDWSDTRRYIGLARSALLLLMSEMIGISQLVRKGCIWSEVRIDARSLDESSAFRWTELLRSIFHWKAERLAVVWVLS